jgi:hypothetical protein
MHGRRLAFLFNAFTSLADQLMNSWHTPLEVR